MPPQAQPLQLYLAQLPTVKITLHPMVMSSMLSASKIMLVEI